MEVTLDTPMRWFAKSATLWGETGVFLEEPRKFPEGGCQNEPLTAYGVALLPEYTEPSCRTRTYLICFLNFTASMECSARCPVATRAARTAREFSMELL